jgi:hypothetical protein
VGEDFFCFRQRAYALWLAKMPGLPTLFELRQGKRAPGDPEALRVDLGAQERENEIGYDRGGQHNGDHDKRHACRKIGHIMDWAHDRTCSM